MAPPGGTLRPTLAYSPVPRWNIPSPPDPAVVRRLEGALRLPRALCAVLAARGLDEPDRARTFLRPRLDGLHPPESLTDAVRAADRILGAIRREETVLVHGDYDVDGISGTALLTRWIRRLGGRAVPFVPHRLRDGYDFGAAGIRAATEAGAALVVTVDCGISAAESVRRAREVGLDVVVTDHHTPPDTLPPALAVVNPNRSDCTYPNAGLCGTGVAFKLCELLARRRGVGRDELLPSLDLVALATVADLVPLEGENRVLVRFGLRALASTPNPGLRALLARTGLDGEPVEAGQVGFVVAPRINAVGRIGEASDALRLLLTEDADEAERLAGRLDDQNRLRQQEDRRTLAEALQLLARDFDPDRHWGVVLASEGWHPGVIGIVASRVVERIHRPTVLVALDGDSARGSARSIRGFHLFEGIRSCASHLVRYGGHRAAAGMDLSPDALPAFRRAFNEAVRGTLAPEALQPELRADLELPLEEVTDDLVHYLRYAGPFGMANRRPVFAARGLEVVTEPRVVGSGHLKLRLRKGRVRIDAIGFRMAERIPPGSVGRGPVDVLFHAQHNEYRGRRRLQARLVDLRPSVAGA